MTTLFFDCTSCKEEMVLEVRYHPGSPARTWGPPEFCDPGEGSELDIISPDKCPHCGSEIDYEKALEKADSVYEGQFYDGNP